MEFEGGSVSNNNPEDSNIELKDILAKYLIHWKWFLLSVVICILAALYKLNFARPQYKAISSIKIEDQKSGESSTLSLFQDLSIVNGPNQQLIDEIEILKSKTLSAEVIKSLGLNVQFFTNKNFLSDLLDSRLGFESEFYEKEEYKSSPLKINFFISDSILYRTNSKFVVQIKSPNNFNIYNLDTKETSKKYAFGEKISLEFGEIIVTPTVNLKQSNLIGEGVLVRIINVPDLATAYSASLTVEPKEENSNVVSLSNKAGVKQKAVDFLNKLVQKYNERSVLLKEELSKSTSDFVDKRLAIISNELSDVDNTAETLKTRYRISDVASETGLNMQSGQELEKQIVQTNTQLQQIGYVKDFVSSKDENDFIPVNLGLTDNNVQTSVQQYNQLLLDKKRLLENSTERNPIVVNINEQLKDLKSNISLGLDNLESSQKISLDALNKQDALINSRLYSAPRQERQIRDVQRQQQIKESLYLYLLQKREETAITLGVVDPNAKVIDPAESLHRAISPNKMIFYLAALFAGIFIPFVFFYLKDFLDTKVRTVEDVEKVLPIPILGDIPKITSKGGYLIKKEDYSPVAEAFRILRTNLNFILPKKSSEELGKVVFVTSSIAHEGKSFVGANLSTALAHAGKKTILLGMDVRAPGIKPYLNIRGKSGVTNYIINGDLSPEDVVINVPSVENLDLISSGDLAPNPAELLLNPRIKELFDYAKKNYDYIIVDTAAFSMVTDSLVLSDFADAFIYVIRANFLDKRMLRYIGFLYKEKRIPNMALLINGVDHKKSYGYGYGYGYGIKYEKSKKKWWRLNFG